jgi:hypothetical protein
MNSNDIELLRRYVFERSEAAFADLVRQHIALVYSAALRRTHGNATNSPPVLGAYGQMSVTIPAEPRTGQFDAGELVLRRAKQSAAPGGLR